MNNIPLSVKSIPGPNSYQQQLDFQQRTLNLETKKKPTKNLQKTPYYRSEKVSQFLQLHSRLQKWQNFSSSRFLRTRSTNISLE